jgi:hypothetical protein
MSVFTIIPTELFLEIAFHLARDDPPIPQNHVGPVESLGWIRATHVCRSWKNFWLSVPDLWRGILGRVPRALPTLLARAGDVAPLALHSRCEIMGRGRDIQEPVGFVKTPVPFTRVRFINLYTYGRDRAVYPCLYLLAKTEASILDSLDVMFLKAPFDRGANLDSFPGLRAPALRRLHLVGPSIPFSAPALTHLHLSEALGGKCDTLSSMQAPLDILAACPRLEHLTLGRIYIATVGVQEVISGLMERAPVALPHLAHLRINTDMPRCTPVALALLDALVLPPSATVTGRSLATSVSRFSPSRGARFAANSRQYLRYRV